MINSKYIEELKILGFNSNIDALESYIETLQDSFADGKSIVQDYEYDRLKRLLGDLKPDSKVLRRDYNKDSSGEIDSYDKLLEQYGMRKIKNCLDRIDIEEFISDVVDHKVDVCTSFKLKGTACRIVYEWGDLVSATTEGKQPNKKGRDITRHIKTLLGDHNDYLEGYDLVEIRGVLTIRNDDFENRLKYEYKNPLNVVSHLIRNNATDRELKYLHFVSYKILVNDDDNFYDTLESELDQLSTIGFEIPEYEVYEIQSSDDIENILHEFEEKELNGVPKYSTDGIVIAVNDNHDFYALGLKDDKYKANIAVKMGIWEHSNYASTIREIQWCNNGEDLVPVAIIDPIVTVTGKTVRSLNIPNLGILTKLNLIPGNKINFEYNGKDGIRLLSQDGLIITMI